MCGWYAAEEKMPKLFKKHILNTSLRLNIMVVCETVLLLLATLVVMFYFARHALHKEAIQDAEQTLEGTVQHIDNILTSVEQSADNIYHELEANLDQPDRMSDYCTRLVECNTHIEGCAVAFIPDYYPGQELFMAYVRRTSDGSSELIAKESFGSTPYTEQVWFTEPIAKSCACWIDPLPDEEGEGVTISFCMPIFDEGKEVRGEQQIVGVMAVDVSVEQLSDIVLAAKSSPHSYCVLLDRDGGYIVHPDDEKLQNQTVFNQTEHGANPSLHEAAAAMVAGETGYKPFTLNGEDWYVFYKPFVHTSVIGHPMEQLGWSVGEIHPKNDIYGSYNILLLWVIVITVVGVLLFFVLCRIVIRRQLTPLRQLTHSAQRIAEGHYDEIIPDPQREDEIGQLEGNFQQMQQSLAAHMSELKLLKATLQDRDKVLQKASGYSIENDRVKSAFLHYITNQMTAPTEALDKSVTTLCNNYQTISEEDAQREVKNIKQQSETVMKLLDHMIEAAQIEPGKEGSNE